MKYINAKTILPEALIEELQNYVQAGYIYVPAKEEQRKSWGELSGYRTGAVTRKAMTVKPGDDLFAPNMSRAFPQRTLPAAIAFPYLLYEKLFIRNNKGTAVSKKSRDAAVLFYKTVPYYSVDCRKESPPGKIFSEHSPRQSTI